MSPFFIRWLKGKTRTSREKFKIIIIEMRVFSKTHFNSIQSTFLLLSYRKENVIYWYWNEEGLSKDSFVKISIDDVIKENLEISGSDSLQVFN